MALYPLNARMDFVVMGEHGLEQALNLVVDEDATHWVELDAGLVLIRILPSQFSEEMASKGVFPFLAPLDTEQLASQIAEWARRLSETRHEQLAGHRSSDFIPEEFARHRGAFRLIRGEHGGVDEAQSTSAHIQGSFIMVVPQWAYEDPED